MEQRRVLLSAADAGDSNIGVGFAVLDGLEFEGVDFIVFVDDLFFEVDDVQLEPLDFGGHLLFVCLLVLQFLHELVDQLFQLYLHAFAEISREAGVAVVGLAIPFADFADLTRSGDLRATQFDFHLLQLCQETVLGFLEGCIFYFQLLNKLRLLLQFTGQIGNLLAEFENGFVLLLYLGLELLLVSGE